MLMPLAVAQSFCQFFRHLARRPNKTRRIETRALPLKTRAARYPERGDPLG